MTIHQSTNVGYIRRIADALLATSVGDTITYSQISAACGFAIQDRRHLIAPAMQLANKESGANFNNVRMSGYARLPNSAAHAVGKKARLKARRAVKRSNAAIANTIAKANDMTLDDLRKALSEQAALSILYIMSMDKHLPKSTADEKPPAVEDVVRATIEAIEAARKK